MSGGYVFSAALKSNGKLDSSTLSNESPITTNKPSVTASENNYGYPYCYLDYHELFSPKCRHCGNTIEGFFITALGKSWHQEHFFCHECGNPFESGGFMVNDGFPYCEKD
ncbi:21368_t:CDS:2 [Dentiscutata erythropus]|uniref:21368_t:CDS:1 n=1 Tax=Dentiscutata erythropus TaxID=1348616 RepID=A0A9N9IK95_9GLOM|nr:21368_t:CDS:2 [Dentiscutata erythropus]